MSQVLELFLILTLDTVNSTPCSLELQAGK